MARSDQHFKKTYNDTLDRLKMRMCFTNPTDLAAQIGVSRTTSRKICNKLIQNQIIQKTDNSFTLARVPVDDDFFAKEETMTTEAQIQLKLMTWVIDRNIQDGSAFSEAQFVREFGISHSSIREFLIRLSSFGLIRKEPNRHWVFQGMTPDYAEEIYEFRKFFEFRSVHKIINLPQESPFWIDLATIRLKHEHALRNDLDTPDQTKELDAAFHSLLNSASQNRFLLASDDAISLLFFCHYHLTMDQTQTLHRNRRALADHIRIIDALTARDLETALLELEHHLDDAKVALISRL